MGTQVTYPAFDCFYVAEVVIATKKVMDDLVLNAIILRCEGEKGSPGLVKLGIRISVERDPHITNCQLYTAKGEGSGVGWCVCVFSWTKEGEDCNDDYICGGLKAFGVMREILGDERNAVYD